MTNAIHQSTVNHIVFLSREHLVNLGACSDGLGLFDAGIVDQNVLGSHRLGRLIVACAEEGDIDLHGDVLNHEFTFEQDGRTVGTTTRRCTTVDPTGVKFSSAPLLGLPLRSALLGTLSSPELAPFSAIPSTPGSQAGTSIRLRGRVR